MQAHEKEFQRIIRKLREIDRKILLASAKIIKTPQPKRRLAKTNQGNKSK